MKVISIYTPYLFTFGGGEKYVLILAEVLSKLPGIQVTLLSTEPRVQFDTLLKFSGLNLERVNYHIVQNKNQIKKFTQYSDIFIYLSNFGLSRSMAKYHVQLLQVPYGKINLLTMGKKVLNGNIKELIKDIFRLRLLKFARYEADLVITNSQFVHDIIKSNFQIESEALFPPIQDFFVNGITKKKIVLSVGRFFNGLYNNKRYDILTEAFRMAFQNELQGWEYHIVGTAATDQATQKMIHVLQEKNKGYPIYFHFNVQYSLLKKLYNEATLFWHAAGYGVNENQNPENVEHFGMSTVESMSAKCIPIVVNKGGQREIITHGKNGFLWNIIDELIAYSGKVAQNQVPIIEIQEEARKRFNYYAIDEFSRRAIRILSPLLTK